MVITMKRCSLVKPAKPIPNENISLADCDQDKPITHTPIIYFYKPSSNPLFSFALASQTLKNALSQVLVHFYPLAGRLHIADDRGRVNLECSSAGAVFIEAESDARIKDFKDFAPTKELRSLIPSCDASLELHQQPLLLVQLTRFGCGGVSVGLAISHIIADGTSTSHFVAEWARIARGEPLLNPPSLDRSILVGSGSMSSYMNNNSLAKSNRYDPLPLLIGKHNDLEERSKETEVVMLHLSAAEILRLKEVANEGRASSKVRGYSLYEVVSAHMWRCACKARDHRPDQPTRLAVAVNFRKIMSSLPKWYFGNSYYKAFASSTSGELTTMPLAYAASKIREAKEMVTEEYVKLNLDLVSVQPDLNRYRTFHIVGTNHGSFVGNPNMAVSSWLTVPIAVKDFGWGEPIFIGLGSINFDGKCIIYPGRSEVGSVTIALRLQTAHIDNFKKYFYEAISESVLSSPHPVAGASYSRIKSRY